MVYVTNRFAKTGLGDKTGTLSMASIVKREGGWQAKVRRRGYPPQSKTFVTRAQAEAWARAVEREMDRGSFVSTSTAERTLFAELAERFSEDYARFHYRGDGWRYKLARLRERLDRFSMAAITPEVVATYRDERLQDVDPRYKSISRKVSSATVKTELDLLSKIFDVAQKDFAIHLPFGNPVRGIRKPRDAAPRERRLSHEEFRRLEDACRQSRCRLLHTAFLLAVETAMRQSELLNLRRSDVDLLARTAHLQETKNGEPRAVPLTSRAVEIIKNLPASLAGDDRLIPLSKPALHSAFKRACKKAQIEDLRWHDLRHESLSRFAERGDLNLLELAAISGHKSASSLKMLKTYVHFHASQLAKKLG